MTAVISLTRRTSSSEGFDNQRLAPLGLAAVSLITAQNWLIPPRHPDSVGSKGRHTQGRELRTFRPTPGRSPSPSLRAIGPPTPTATGASPRP